MSGGERQPVPGERHAGPDLRLVAEARVADLIGDAGGRRLEASGVVAVRGQFYVIFDNAPDIGRLDAALAPGDGNLLVSQEERDGDLGFEDIAYDPDGDRFFLLVEAARRDDELMARVHEHDGSLVYRRSDWLDVPLRRRNKGLEGLTFVRRNGDAHLLGMCEGNRCRDGDAGRRPGGGRIHLFTERAAQDPEPVTRWERAATIRLPETVWFEDFSSLSMMGDRVAVVSQSSSALWVGTFRTSGWELDGEGRIHRFPRDDEGRATYCNVEGVSWVGPDRVVVVSDKAKATQGQRCRAKDQSIHVFDVP